MNRAPAFTLSLGIVIGALSALYHPAALLFTLFLFNRHFLRTLLIGIASACMVWCRVELPSVEFEGAGPFSIFSISSMHDGWMYRGLWHPHQKAIPVSLIIRDDGVVERPPATNDWWIEGALKISEDGRYNIKVDLYRPWLSVPFSFNLGERRLSAKDTVKNWIGRHIRHIPSAVFLTGIATGAFDDQEMISQFSRFGLQHIMAISGFHFALIAGFLGWCLRPVFGHRMTCAALICLLTIYCLFLGYAPSVLRAWATLMIVLAGYCFGRTTSGLNSLGLAISVLVIWDPLLLHTIGFCFSCLSTAAILLFYGPAERLISKLLPKRTLDKSTLLTRIDQHGYCLSSLLRGMLSLTLAVNVVAVPATLYYFQYFPVMGLVYNLFFPLFVTVSMVLLILSIPLPFLHPINEWWTSHILDFTSNMPSFVDFGLSVEGFSPWIFGGLLGLLLLICRYYESTKAGLKV